LETSKKELQEKVEELKKATDFKNRIFSIIGHDLRGPIGTISSILSLAMEDQLSEEKRQLMLSLTKESAVATYSLLENLLIWANNEQGDISYNSQNLYFRELVQDNVNLLKEKASEKSIELFLEIEKSLQVYADYNTVDTIVRNLLSNALKFTYKNGRIEISAINKNGFVEISVVDNGIGIGAANLKKILDTDIHYTDRGTHGEKGSGLGLALCFEFIKMNKGSYQIHSQEGQGTRFVFTLPGAVNQ
jgi:signal transduction histidine kinase